MAYNQTRMNGMAMPLLMGITKPSSIKTAANGVQPVYDPMSQTIVFDMRLVGTYSLKNSMTRRANGNNYLDQKNEIDDHKNVV